MGRIHRYRTLAWRCARCQLVQYLNQPIRAVACACRQHHACGIRFVLGAFVQTSPQHRGAFTQNLVEQLPAAATACPRLGNLRKRINTCLLLHDGNVMTLNDMRDFVTEHPRQLRFVIQQIVETAGNQDKPSRHGKRIHRRMINHAKMPCEISALTLRRDPAPHAIHIGLQIGVIHQRRHAQRAAGEFAPDLNFVLFIHAADRGYRTLARAENTVEIETLRRCGAR